MGLDMYTLTTSHDIPEVDFGEPDDTARLFYWRKHPDLHGWMEQLYRRKGGGEEEFNLTPVRLDAADLDALEQAVLKDELPHTVGFFFGESRGEEKSLDLEFIGRAREIIKAGKKVYYTSWW